MYRTREEWQGRRAELGLRARAIIPALRGLELRRKWMDARGRSWDYQGPGHHATRSPGSARSNRRRRGPPSRNWWLEAPPVGRRLERQPWRLEMQSTIRPRSAADRYPPRYDGQGGPRVSAEPWSPQGGGRTRVALVVSGPTGRSRCHAPSASQRLLVRGPRGANLPPAREDE